MKLQKNNIKINSAFTLVELLVVIAIIGTLASISIPIGTRMINSSKATQAQSQMKAVILAFSNFRDDHNSVSFGISHGNDTWHSTATTDDPNNGHLAVANNDIDKFYTAVSGEQTIESFTRTKKNYLTSISDAVDMDNNNVRGGLTRNSTNNNVHGLVDPWGRAYMGVLDTGMTGKIETSTGIGTTNSNKSFRLGNDTYFLISKGIDGQWGTEDDILSH